MRKHDADRFRHIASPPFQEEVYHPKGDEGTEAGKLAAGAPIWKLRTGPLGNPFSAEMSHRIPFRYTPGAQLQNAPAGVLGGTGPIFYNYAPHCLPKPNAIGEGGTPEGI